MLRQSAAYDRAFLVAHNVEAFIAAPAGSCPAFASGLFMAREPRTCRLALKLKTDAERKRERLDAGTHAEIFLVDAYPLARVPSILG